MYSLADVSPRCRSLRRDHDEMYFLAITRRRIELGEEADCARALPRERFERSILDVMRRFHWGFTR